MLDLHFWEGLRGVLRGFHKTSELGAKSFFLRRRNAFALLFGSNLLETRFLFLRRVVAGGVRVFLLVCHLGLLLTLSFFELGRWD